MRVIAGDLKGRRLVAVPGETTRPTADRVKESVFNILGPYFTGGRVLDLFAGTGALGIEALSRGMERAVFVDHDVKAIQVVRKNVLACGLTDRAEIYRADARRAIGALAKRGQPFDLVFMDPPYQLDVIPELAAALVDRCLLQDSAVIVAEHGKQRRLPNRIGEFGLWKSVTYGDTAVSFYRKGTFSA